MKVVFIEDVEQVIVKDIDVPLLKQDEVLLRVKLAGICGSDIHAYRGQHPFRKAPVSIGHEVSGKIVKVGTNVTDIQVGDKVTVLPQIGCSKCVYCKEGKENYCIHRGAPGVGDWIGMMGEFVIAPKEYIFRLSEGIGHDLGVLAEPLAVGFHAVGRTEISKEAKIAIIGSGPIGLTTLIAVLEKHVNQVLVTDIMDYPLQVAKNLGSTFTLNSRKSADWVQEAIDINNGLFDVVFITAGVKNIVNEALYLTKKGGKVITVAMFQSQQEVDIAELQGTEKELIGCMTYNREDFSQAVSYINQGKTAITQMISHIIPVDNSEHAFNLVNHKEDNSLKVLISF